MTDLSHIADNLARIKDRMEAAATRAGRNPSDITLVAVTKTYPVQYVAAAAEAGLKDMGENRVQEAIPKITAAPAGITWHLIGHLQSNKARVAIENFQMIHSLDSVKLAADLSRHACNAGVTRDVLLQVNISGEETKSGFEPDDVEPAIGKILETCPGLLIAGFMTMAPLANPEQARPTFTGLRQLRDRLKNSFSHPMYAPDHLSMGMSNDFEQAIEEGATLIRVGSSLFRS